MKSESSKSSTPDKSRKPDLVTKDRIKRNLADYERLKKKVEQALYHHSEGLWGWVADTAEVVSGWVGDAYNTVTGEIGDFVSDAWDSVNNVIDEYVWDTDEDIAVVEGLVKDTYDTVKGVVDEYIWDGDDDVAVVEGWIKDAWNWVTGDADGEIATVVDDIIEGGKDAIDDVVEAIKGGGGSILGGAKKLIGDLWALINALKEIFGTLFDSALGAITLLPELLTELFTINEKTYVADAIRMVSLNAKLGEQLRKGKE